MGTDKTAIATGNWDHANDLLVPTGYVPRVATSGFVRVVDDRRPHDPIAQAVDDYLLMERKARAWDALRAEALRWAKGHDRDLVLELMGELVHPAQGSST